jgi:ubiquinone biosynthesis UbiH/UbiF/VisC/COQ6 family hydroxylase
MKDESIVVCGTGIAGLAMALGLAKGRHAVTLVGPKPSGATYTGDEYCPRVYAMSPASRDFLKRLGVWDMMDARRIMAVESMEIYGDASGAVHLHAWQAAQDALAWIVESSEMERVLQQAVQVYGIVWHAEKFRRIESSTVFTESGRALQADLVIGADGAQSPVREAAGITLNSRPYGDMGLVAHLHAELPHQHTALQWFTGDSVLALLPMPDTGAGHQVSMVWSMPEHDARELLDMDATDRGATLETRLDAATGRRLGRLQLQSGVFGFPLFLESSGMIAPGVALVGDAAHRVHPLAGQGLNLGLGDVEALLKVLDDKEAYRGPGDMRVLNRYRRARAEPILAMRMATDGLHRLFGIHAAPAVWGRNVGMQWVDRLPFVKRLLIEGAGGS